MTLIPLVAPCITQHDRDYMAERIRGGLLEDESEVTLFEEAFAEYVGCAAAVAVCSGTVALKRAQRLLRTTNKNEVTIPSFTCLAVRDACRGRQVLYADSRFDVPSQTLTINHDDLEPLTVLPHAFGVRSVAWGGVVEDWTLSLGGVGRLRGMIGACSTHWSKMISTGHGGAVFGDDIELLYEVRAKVDERGCVMSATQAALGVSQLEQLDAFIARRREIAAYYSDRFVLAGIKHPAADCKSVFFRYIIAVDDPAGKVRWLAENGVEAGRGVNPLLHRLAGLPDDDFPGACRDADRLLSVPVHPSLSDAEVEYVADQVVKVCGR